MKNINKIFAIAIVALGFSTSALAQSTASATASATILSPITITKTVDMNFGNMAVQVATGGTVLLTPAGVRTPSNGVTTGVLGGTVTAASFTIGGVGSSTYSIGLPVGNHTITRNTGTETMIVNAFTSSPTPTGTLSVGGTQTLTVGATLNVSAAQVPGTYVSATGFDVTVNYN